ncbi:MAG: helix-turn-helix transcriptional regulator [Coprococcus sp.]|nr:helix-turn-helix transcriptional regulator [Coprococcus sp.]
MNLKDNGYCKTKKQSQSMPNNLFLYRQRANISQDKLAEAVDCSRRTIGNIENGTHDPSVQMAYRIANYFKVALPILFPDLNENKEA